MVGPFAGSSLSLDRDAFTRQFPALSTHLKPAQVDALLGSMTAVPLEPGTVLIRQGERVDRLSLAVEGEFSVDLHGTHLATLTTGSLIGEVAWIDGGVATSTVTAGAGCSVLQVDRPASERLRRDHPEVAANLYRAVSRSIATRLRAAEAHEDGADGQGAVAPRKGMMDALIALFARTGG